MGHKAFQRFSKVLLSPMGHQGHSFTTLLHQSSMHTIIHFMEYLSIMQVISEKINHTNGRLSIGKVNSFKVTCLSIMSEFSTKLNRISPDFLLNLLKEQLVLNKKKI